jgi:hypothetical protein
MRGVAEPPEIRRRNPGAVRSAPGAADVEDRIRRTLGEAQRKLLASKRKLEASVAALRIKLATRTRGNRPSS